MQTKRTSKTLALLLALAMALMTATAAFAAATPESAQAKALDYLAAKNSAPAVGNEWQLLALARGGRQVPKSYLAEVLEYIKNKNGKWDSATDNARVVLALTAMGVDARDFAGYDLLESLEDFSFVADQQPNGPVYALLAFHSAYQLPADYAKKLVDAVLAQRLPDGSWTYGFAASVDPDMTAMALQALAPYYHARADVKSAVDTALALLADVQQNGGGFGVDWGYGAGLEENACSAAQVVTALSVLGRDAAAFAKGGGSVLDALLAYQNPNGSFLSAWEAESMFDTEQAAYALTAYSRYKTGANSLFDMRDVTLAPYRDPSVRTWLDKLPDWLSAIRNWKPWAQKLVYYVFFGWIWDVIK